MSDIFQEVDDDLRQDRMQALAKRYGGVAIGVAIAIVVATGGYKAWQTWHLSQRQTATIELLNGMETAVKDTTGNVDALVAYARKGAPGDLATLARIEAGAALARAGKTDDAVAVFDGVAAGEGDAVYREAASLLSVMHQIDKGDPAQLSGRLNALAAETSPWRYSARELLGVLAIRGGDAEKAKTLFKQLSEDAGAPAGVRARAADLAALYGQS
jgi:hypothetical protein